MAPRRPRKQNPERPQGIPGCPRGPRRALGGSRRPQQAPEDHRRPQAPRRHRRRGLERTHEAPGGPSRLQETPGMAQDPKRPWIAPRTPQGAPGDPRSADLARIRFPSPSQSVSCDRLHTEMLACIVRFRALWGLGSSGSTFFAPQASPGAESRLGRPIASGFEFPQGSGSEDLLGSGQLSASVLSGVPSQTVPHFSLTSSSPMGADLLWLR